MDHLAGLLRPIVAGEFHGNATAFARAVGISQSQMSQVLKGSKGDRGVGVGSLVALRNYLQMEIHEMLNLPPLRSASSKPASAPPNELQAAVEAALVSLVSQGRLSPPPTPAPPPQEPGHPRRRRA